MKRITTISVLVALIAVMSACVIGPREGYYDRDHSRYYHQNAWHNCGQNDQHCH